jgi:hypothetical protein
MSGCIELYDKIKSNAQVENNPNPNPDSSPDLIILCPNIDGIKKSINNSARSISLLCSASEQFSLKNLHSSKKNSLGNVYEQLEYLISKDYELIRIYISCSFGSIWEDFDDIYIEHVIKIVDQIYNIAKIKNISSNKLDIVLSDTFGLANENRIKKIYENLKKNIGLDIFNYLALHLHTLQQKSTLNNFEYNKSIGFEQLILVSLDYEIKKYDSSICGIGGCPFGEKELKGNISTYDLYNFLIGQGYEFDIDTKKLEENSFQIKKILDT